MNSKKRKSMRLSVEADLQLDEISEDNNIQEKQRQLYSYIGVRGIAFGIGIFIILLLFSLVYMYLTQDTLAYLKPEISEAKQENLHYNLKEPNSITPASTEIDLSDIDAASVYAFNPDTFEIYAQRNIHEKRNIASITKLLAAVIIVEEYDLNEIIEVEKGLPEDHLHVLSLKKGDKIKVEDALNAMLISSFNDVPFVLADKYEGGYNGFVKAMNQKAQLLGMHDSKFTNPTGYDADNNISTANDIHKLVVYILQKTDIVEITAKGTESISVARADGEVERVLLETTNDLFDVDPYAKGLKTGYTLGAGQSLVGLFDASTTEIESGRAEMITKDRVVTILLGSGENRFDETLELMRLVRGG